MLQEIDNILARLDPTIQVGIAITSLKTGKCLYERNADAFFTPASTCKLLIAGAALSLLGSDATFLTRLLIDGSGNLYFQGSGDPSFSISDLEKLISQTDLKKIEGDIFLDHSAFDDQQTLPSWPEKPLYSSWFSPLDAIAINHNSYDVTVTPTEIGKPPTIILSPEIENLEIDNRATCAEKESDLTVERRPNSNVIEITGEVGREIESTRTPFQDAHESASILIRQALQKAGIRFDGKISSSSTPQDVKVIASHTSLPLSFLLQTLLKESDNLYADLLFKKIGQHYSHAQGNWKNGKEALFHHLEKELHVSDLTIFDGSGLSKENRLSPRYVVEYISWLYNYSPHKETFFSALAQFGKEGTLKDRLVDNPPPIRAKTGTLDGVSCLSGIVEAEGKDPLSFSVLINGFTEEASKYEAEMIDSICRILSSL